MTPSRRLLTRGFIAVVALLFASAGFVSLWRLVEERDNSLERFRAGSWTAVQAEIEVLRLMDAMTAYYHDENVGRDEVLRRFEIFWSRIPLLLEGDEGTIVRRLMPETAIERLFQELPAMERSLLALRPGDRQEYSRLRAELENMRGILHDMVLRVMAHDISVENRLRLTRSYTEIFVAFTLVIVCGTLLLLLLLRELRESSRLLVQSQRAAREAAEANQSKSRFLAAASHDLRQPLNALSLLLGLLQSRAKDPSSIGLIEKSQEAVLSITKQLDSYLNITKIDTGRIQMQRTVVPLGQLVRRVAKDFADEAARKGVRLRVVDCGVSVQTDAFLLERIISNLVANAVRYTEHGAVLIGCRRRGESVRLDVIDTGPGIAPEHQKAIFDEFFQIANAERAQTEGHGLGLAIVRRLVRLLGHQLELRSTPGRGSRFSVLLPRVDDVQQPAEAETPIRLHAGSPPAASQIKQREPAAERGDERPVLIVEDDALIAMSMSLMIEDFGGTAITARSAESAVDLVRSHGLKPRLVVADYRLPGRNGIEAIADLRRLLGVQVPACIVTGDIDPKVKAEAFTRGIGHLSKPITAADLRTVFCGTEKKQAVG